jgi:hypothetical protein
MAFAPASVYAVDGTILINQATVNAAGGFPYIISQPGSYKLSGNLTMNTTSTGNHVLLNGALGDIAIGITASDVAFDLNGFSIFVNNSDAHISHSFVAIAELGTYARISIRNGNVTLNSPDLLFQFSQGLGVFLPTSTYSSVEELSIWAGFFSSALGAGSSSLVLGQQALVRHNRLRSSLGSNFTCPSLLVENVGENLSVWTSPCIALNNAP